MFPFYYEPPLGTPFPRGVVRKKKQPLEIIGLVHVKSPRVVT